MFWPQSIIITDYSVLTITLRPMIMGFGSSDASFQMKDGDQCIGLELLSGINKMFLGATTKSNALNTEQCANHQK